MILLEIKSNPTVVFVIEVRKTHQKNQLNQPTKKKALPMN